MKESCQKQIKMGAAPVSTIARISKYEGMNERLSRRDRSAGAARFMEFSFLCQARAAWQIDTLSQR